MTRRRLSPEQRREELLDAATEVVLREGSDHLTLEVVAVEAGCSRNLAYSYFPNRDDLVSSLVERERRRLVAAIIEQIPRPAAFGPWMRAWIRLTFDEAEARGPMLVMWFENTDRPAARKRSGGFLLAAIEAKLRETGTVDHERVPVIARLLAGAWLAGAVAVAVEGCQRELVEQELLALADGLVG